VPSATSTFNGACPDFAGSFGSFKQLGNGRERRKAGLEEYMELKAIFGFVPRYRIYLK
jgi:aldehyde dehydrogenase (NAD+)